FLRSSRQAERSAGNHLHSTARAATPRPRSHGAGGLTREGQSSRWHGAYRAPARAAASDSPHHDASNAPRRGVLPARCAARTGSARHALGHGPGRLALVLALPERVALVVGLLALGH